MRVGRTILRNGIVIATSVLCTSMCFSIGFSSWITASGENAGFGGLVLTDNIVSIDGVSISLENSFLYGQYFYESSNTNVTTGNITYSVDVDVDSLSASIKSLAGNIFNVLVTFSVDNFDSEDSLGNYASVSFNSSAIDSSNIDKSVYNGIRFPISLSKTSDSNDLPLVIMLRQSYLFKYQTVLKNTQFYLKLEWGGE